MDIRDFDYQLPGELIAQAPLPQRDQSRLLTLRRSDGRIGHRKFNEFSDYLERGDMLVFNDSKVIPARLRGVRADTGGKIEVLLLHRLEGDLWEVLVKPGRRAQPGRRFVFGSSLAAEVRASTSHNSFTLRFYYKGVFEEILDRLGQTPLPPYIKQELQDRERYQTIYAREKGSAAAPTAGLHFTQKVMAALSNKGVEFVFITLHVGLGTFRPVREVNPLKHRMHKEFFCLTKAAAERINRAKKEGRRVIAVGTTSCRVLEAAAVAPGVVKPAVGWTGLYIYPGYHFQIIDALLTNFHLPRSTLIMLVSAFGGLELTRRAYHQAVERRYRFYSFGDCMFIY